MIFGLDRRDIRFFGAPPSAWRAALAGVAWRRHLLFMGALGVFFTLAEAFGTGGLPFAARLTLWVLLFCGVCALAVVSCLAVRLKQGRFGAREAGLASALAWPPAVVFAGGVLTLFGQLNSRAEWLWLALSMAVILPVVTLISARWIQHAKPESDAADGKARQSAQASLLAALPEKARGKILALKGEDHYVRVITDKGEGLVLARLRDAAAGMDGLWAHRSVWVAKEAVKDWRSNSAGMRLYLLNGMEVPVARARRRQVRAAVSRSASFPGGGGGGD